MPRSSTWNAAIDLFDAMMLAACDTASAPPESIKATKPRSIVTVSPFAVS